MVGTDGRGNDVGEGDEDGNDWNGDGNDDDGGDAMVVMMMAMVRWWWWW